MADDTIDAVLSGLMRFEWVADRLELAAIQPRHIGRPVTFTVYTEPENEQSYDSRRCVGTLEGVDGQTLIVSGTDYDYNTIAGLKVWRKQVKR